MNAAICAVRERFSWQVVHLCHVSRSYKSVGLPTYSRVECRHHRRFHLWQGSMIHFRNWARLSDCSTNGGTSSLTTNLLHPKVQIVRLWTGSLPIKTGPQPVLNKCLTYTAHYQSLRMTLETLLKRSSKRCRRPGLRFPQGQAHNTVPRELCRRPQPCWTDLARQNKIWHRYIVGRQA